MPIPHSATHPLPPPPAPAPLAANSRASPSSCAIPGTPTTNHSLTRPLTPLLPPPPKKNAQPGEPAWRAPPVGGEALGRDVSVWWTKEKEFFPGTVTAWEEATGRATVTFWDGDVETYKLEEEQVAWH